MINSHSFNIEIACRYGVEEAIIIENFMFWTKTNVYNGTLQEDGLSYTYYTAKSLTEMFPYIKERTIADKLAKMEKRGILKSSKEFNNTKYDRTKWYAITSIEIFQMYFEKDLNKDEKIKEYVAKNPCICSFAKIANGNAETANQFAKSANRTSVDCQTIPNINTNINTNNKTTTKKDNLDKIDQEPKQPEKSSSSVSGEIREIKKALTESGLEIATCKNIMSLVHDNKIDLNRIKEVLAYAKTKSWEDGAIYKALNENWNVKEFKSNGSKSDVKRSTPANTFNPEAKKQADEDFTKTLEERVPTVEEIERAKELCRLNGIFAPKMPTVLARTYLKQFGEWRD